MPDPDHRRATIPGPCLVRNDDVHGHIPKKNLDGQTLLIYFIAAMKELNNIPVVPREPSASPSGSLCFYAAHRHTHHTGSATFRAICSAVD